MHRSWILTKLLFCFCLSLIVLYGEDFGHASSSPLQSSVFPRDGVGAGLAIDVTAQPSRLEVHGSAERPRIVAFGNSLTAGLGVATTESYPAQLQRTLDAAGYAYRVVNAGISGDTTAGGVRRVSWVLTSKPAIVILELGANDGLRGLSLHETEANLEKIIQQFQQASVTVVLAGMKLPPNYGQEYTDGFEALYRAVAKQYHLTLIPFFLDGVAGSSSLNQSDGIHPTGEGYRLIVEKIFPVLEPLLKRNR
ncbi:MAG TPA: arylesterase [Nitrospiraceae bacterium]|jgi:acyl-CoA thioesterase-1|nr:arylesterase [Nitrospiraceae bacterium]